jgi:hypothetical protein
VATGPSQLLMLLLTHYVAPPTQFDATLLSF